MIPKNRGRCDPVSPGDGDAHTCHRKCARFTLRLLCFNVFLISYHLSCGLSTDADFCGPEQSLKEKRERTIFWVSNMYQTLRYML